MDSMKTASAGLLFLLCPLFGQAPSTIASVGYAAPKPVVVAPGQVVILFTRTQTRLAQAIVATGATLPTTLGGFSVALSQTLSANPIAVPLLSVAPAQTCFTISVGCTEYTAITVQIPFELVPNVEGSRLPENLAAVTVTDNGTKGEAIALSPATDSIHILNSCDTPLNSQPAPCHPVFLHADDTMVTSKNPANPGEMISLRAYGLGYADSRVTSGEQSPSPAVTVSGVVMDLSFGRSTLLMPPSSDAASVAAQLVPGAIGLYQLTFQVPAIPDATPECTASQNNFVVAIGRGASFDSAGICVMPLLPSGSLASPGRKPAKRD